MYTCMFTNHGPTVHKKDIDNLKLVCSQIMVLQRKKMFTNHGPTSHKKDIDNLKLLKFKAQIVQEEVNVVFGKKL